MATITLPKRKTMRKKITATGRNGTFNGGVQVIFNHRKEDQGEPGKEPKFFHIVGGNAEGLTWVSNEFTNKEDAVFEANKMDQLVRKHLKEMAEAIIPNLDSVEQNLKNLGYE